MPLVLAHANISDIRSWEPVEGAARQLGPGRQLQPKVHPSQQSDSPRADDPFEVHVQDLISLIESQDLVRQIEATPNVAVRLRTQVVGGRGNSRLEGLALQDAELRTEDVPAAAAFIMIGAEPRTDWLRPDLALDEHGFVLTSRDVASADWPLAREPYPFETSRPGVFAAGDVRHGSMKRVAGAVGEGSVTVGSVHRYLTDLAAAPPVRP